MTNIILTVRTIPSLLSWERGLKSCSKLTQVWLIYVAPLVGAWIEIEDLLNMKLADMVAPLVGAWIEITTLQHCDIEALVAPLVGAWIEILLAGHYEMATMVAPLVGAWIEIKSEIYKVLYVSSLLSWERGLKLPVSHVVGLLFSSLLSWERGLKYTHIIYIYIYLIHVAPLVGAWIEIYTYNIYIYISNTCRSSRGSVD